MLCGGFKEFQGLIASSLQGSSGDESRPETAAGEDETGEFNGSFQSSYAMLMLIKPSGRTRSRQRLVCAARPAPFEVVLNAYCKSSLISYRNYGREPI